MGRKVKGAERRLGDLLSYWLIVSLMRVLNLLPFAVSCLIGELAGNLLFYLDRRHRFITLENLERAFRHELSPAQRIRLAKKTYRNLGRILIECICLPTRKPEIIRDYVSISGRDHLYEAQSRGKGVLFLTAHFGNWELMGLAFSLYGFPSAVVARPLDNPYLDRLVERQRTRFGNRVIAKKGAVREIVKCLASGGRVGILMDQNVSAREGVFVDFFDTPASTTPILAALSQKTGAPVVPIFMVPKQGKSGYVIEVGKPLTLIETGNKEKDLIANTARFTSIIEEYIRCYPHCWFWMHRRWKVRPEDQRREWGRVRQMEKEPQIKEPQKIKEPENKSLR